jgi:hypothetical protein
MKTKNTLSIYLSIFYLICLALSLFGFFANIFSLLDTSLSLLFIPELEYKKITNIFLFACLIFGSWGYFVWENSFLDKLDYVVLAMCIIWTIDGCIGIVRDIPTSINILCVCIRSF